MGRAAPLHGLSGRRSSRLATIVAWGLALSALIMQLTVFIVLGLHPDGTPERETDPDTFFQLPILLGFLIYAVVGALVASRHTSNLIGWLLIGVGLSFSATLLAEEYLNIAPRNSASLLPWIALLYQPLWIPFVGLIPFVVMLFPDGRVPSRRWWGVVVGLVAFFSVRAFADLGSASVGHARNTYPNPLPFADLLRQIGQLVPDAGPIYALAFLLPAIALLARLRRSEGVERQQLKWFVYAAAVMLGSVVALTASELLGLNTTELGDALWMMVMLSLTLLPMAIGIAILRFHLYDIDLVINRTLVYAALTAMLGAVYFMLVITLQGLMSGFTGGSNLAVAASTLAVAALFQPLRRALQRAVDRRFYRSRYDAQRTLAAFGARLRDHLDPAILSEELGAAAGDALQPTFVGVWLRNQDRARRSEA